jgi:hypothetical protein
MVLNMKESTNIVRNMGMENSFGVIHLSIKDSFRIMQYMGKEFISGVMVESMKVIGKIIKWMGKGCLVFLMEECIKVLMLKIGNKVMEFSFGQMEGNTQEIGTIVNSME